jgi:hypothetical protein
VNNSYSVWLHEDMPEGKRAMFEPMSLEDFKKSNTMKIMTPDEAIAMFKNLAATVPVEHFISMVPPGLPLSKFRKYAETFATEVMPAFR